MNTSIIRPVRSCIERLMKTAIIRIVLFHEARKTQEPDFRPRSIRQASPRFLYLNSQLIYAAASAGSTVIRSQKALICSMLMSLLGIMRTRYPSPSSLWVKSLSMLSATLPCLVRSGIFKMTTFDKGITASTT